MKWWVPSRPRVLAMSAAGAVALGVVGWFAGPVWAAGGVLAGPGVAFAAWAMLRARFGPNPEKLLDEQRWQDALADLDRRMPSCRRMAAKRPIFTDVLALRLKQRAKALRGLGQVTEALNADEEAVTIFREWAAAKPRYKGELADGLRLLANLQHAVGHREQALAAAEEAVGLYRDLAAARPEEYLTQLAKALTTQATTLSWLGRYEEALAPVREAERIYQDGSAGKQQPDDAVGAWLTEGILLINLTRHRDAARALAQAWHIAGEAEPQPDWLRKAMTAIQENFPTQFTSAWRSQTGTDPPQWST